MRALRLALSCLVLGVSMTFGPSVAEEVSATGSNFGGVGLVEMRNARFREDGTLEAGGSIRHQRRFYFVNFQALRLISPTE